MNSFTTSLWLILIALFSLTTHPAMTAEPTEASKIGKGSPADWKAAIQKNAAERQNKMDKEEGTVVMKEEDRPGTSEN